MDTVFVCGQTEFDKPFKTYVPLCAAHRALAEKAEIEVFTDRVIARFRL